MTSNVEVRTPKGGQSFTPHSIVLEHIEASFQSAGEYSPFDGTTSDHMECRWIGFKHRTIGMVILISARVQGDNPLFLNGVAAGRRDENGVWTFRYIIGF